MLVGYKFNQLTENILMIHIDLNEQEREILDKALQSYLSDLSYEISDTDDMDFRENLKAKRSVLEKIKDALEKAK